MGGEGDAIRLPEGQSRERPCLGWMPCCSFSTCDLPAEVLALLPLHSSLISAFLAVAVVPVVPHFRHPAYPSQTTN